MSRNGWKAKSRGWTSCSPEETRAIGEELGRQFPAGTVVALHGDLGAGKTTLVKGMVAGLHCCAPDEVTSPTFTYLNVYGAERPLFHFDLYRLAGLEAFEALGFEEYFHLGGLVVMEWAERIGELLPKEHHVVHLHHLGKTRREIRYVAP